MPPGRDDPRRVESASVELTTGKARLPKRVQCTDASCARSRALRCGGGDGARRAGWRVLGQQRQSRVRTGCRIVRDRGRRAGHVGELLVGIFGRRLGRIVRLFFFFGLGLGLRLRLFLGRRRHLLQRHVRERRRLVLVRHGRPLQLRAVQSLGARRSGHLLRRSRLALLRHVHVHRDQVRDRRERGRLRLHDVRERQSVLVLGHRVLHGGELERRLVPLRQQRRLLRDRRHHGEQLPADGDSVRPG